MSVPGVNKSAEHDTNDGNADGDVCDQEAVDVVLTQVLNLIIAVSKVGILLPDFEEEMYENWCIDGVDEEYDQIEQIDEGEIFAHSNQAPADPGTQAGSQMTWPIETIDEILNVDISALDFE